MSTEQKVIALRDEFEDHARYMALEGREVDLNWQTWKATHAKYAPRWLPIDKAAKDGRDVDLWHPECGRLTGYRFNDNSFFGGAFHSWNGRDFGGAAPPGCTHYMPITDAPEVG